MRRRVRPTILPILLAVLWAPAPARAQTGAPDQPVPRPAPPHMAAPAPTPQAPAPQAPPAEAPPGVEVTVLSLDQCLKEALENSLDIAVRRYDPLKSETGVTVSESAFDPLLTGSASKSKDQQKRISAFIGPYSS